MQCDGIIFDMDGTLWDATSSYVKAWNMAYKKLGIEKTMTNELLMSMTGWERRKILNTLFPDKTEAEQDFIIAHVTPLQDEILTTEGGILYPGVMDGLEELSHKYKLFIVSNCAVNTIKQMMRFTGIEKFITDDLAHGQNKMPKSHNIRLIIEKHGLQNPVYVGDTESDGEQCRLAQVPFVYVNYGFGKTSQYDLAFDSFPALKTHFLQL